MIKSPPNHDYETLKSKLNTAKSKLDNFYLASQKNRDYNRKWSHFQVIIDTYHPLKKIVANQYSAQCVTNAWLKYYEIYSTYPAIMPSSSTFVAFFNAELPGAALCAFNHYTKTKHPSSTFDWFASSLMPDVNSNTALGDNYGLFRHNKSKWLMTATNNGDATILPNILDYAARIGPTSHIGGVDLYSHDAGLDVSGTNDNLNFNRQEELNAKLHLGCALVGFLTLKVGGFFIAKQYTFFEPLTRSLLALYSTLFRQLEIIKPKTSRPYNSEIYIIGIHFNGIPSNSLNILSEKLTNFNTSPIPAATPAATPATTPAANNSDNPDNPGPLPRPISDHHMFKIADNLFSSQTEAILTNVNLFNKYKNNLPELGHLNRDDKHKKIQDWLSAVNLQKINKSDWLPAEKSI